MKSNEAIQVLKVLKELIKPDYPEQYISAIDTAIDGLVKSETEYRDEMRI